MLLRSFSNVIYLNSNIAGSFFPTIFSMGILCFGLSVNKNMAIACGVIVCAWGFLQMGLYMKVRSNCVPPYFWYLRGIELFLNYLLLPFCLFFLLLLVA